MTELSPVATVTPEEFAHELETLGATAGRILPGTECKIVDPATGEDMDSSGGAEGEILVRGPQVMKGMFWCV
jgi:long-subunit acyl-CoA synthetase (AMP-forming)